VRGGIGGSGTHVISGILQRGGMFFGDDQNVSRDSLCFTVFFNLSALKLGGKPFRK